MKLGEPYIIGALPFENDQQLIDTKKSDLMNMDAFLKMFTTQLEHQDPMNPMESYELAAQLAQFSTVEQLTKANKFLKHGVEYLSSINNAEAIHLLKKHLSGFTDLITVKNGKPTNLSFSLQEEGTVTINIYDKSGMLVRSIERGKLTPGSYKVNWDGKDNFGNVVPDGDYRIEIELLTLTGNKEIIYPDAEGVAQGIKFIDGLPYLILDKDTGLKMPIGFIVTILEKNDPSSQKPEESNKQDSNLF